MDLTGILSISGYSGLFKLIKQSKAGFIVESLNDSKRMQAFASSKISTLEDIAIYTETGEVHLKEVLRKIFTQEDGKQSSLSSKSSGEELKTYFEKVMPDYDRERVYVSDIRKVIVWYNLLVEKGLVDLEEDKKEEEKKEEIQNEEAVELKDNGEKTEKKPKKKVETAKKAESSVETKKKPAKKSKKEDLDS